MIRENCISSEGIIIDPSITQEIRSIFANGVAPGYKPFNENTKKFFMSLENIIGGLEYKKLKSMFESFEKNNQNVVVNKLNNRCFTLGMSSESFTKDEIQHIGKLIVVESRNIRPSLDFEQNERFLQKKYRYFVNKLNDIEFGSFLGFKALKLVYHEYDHYINLSDVQKSTYLNCLSEDKDYKIQKDEEFNLVMIARIQEGSKHYNIYTGSRKTIKEDNNKGFKFGSLFWHFI